MTPKKPLLETLILDGVDAFVNQSREERLEKVLQDEQQWMRDNADDIDVAIARFEVEQAAEQDAAASSQKTKAAPTVGEVISKIASAFDDAFYAFLDTSGLTPPPALQMELRASSGRRSIHEKFPSSLRGNARGIGHGKEGPNWLPWPPIKSDKTEESWQFLIDWYGKGSAPNTPPRVHLRIDGVDVEAPEVSKLTMDDTAKRIGFNVHVVEPTGFELEELESGDLRYNVLTRKNNPG